MNKISQIIDFLEQAEGLKRLLRHSWLSDGRQESVAEHTWRLALMVLVLHQEVASKINVARALKLAIVHDLGEVYGGDHHAWKGELEEKFENEKQGIEKLVADMPVQQKDLILQLWQEYEDCKTPEAQFVKALDKLEVLLQHNQADISTWNDKEMSFNLVYGNHETENFPVTKILRKVLKEASQRKVDQQKDKKTVK